jgi:acetyltransferase-like isoleucine patch superfamily enzyme
MSVRIHPTAEVSPQSQIGEGTRIWHQAQVREGAILGRGCIIGKGVYIDAGVSIGNYVKIQNYASVYHGVTLEDGVFAGPHVCFTNDLRPRAINPDGSPKSADDWTLTRTLVKQGAALGANSTIVCGITIGAWAMIGAGSVVTRDVPDYGLAWGNPARLRGFVCPCGARLVMEKIMGDLLHARCPHCGQAVTIALKDWEGTR